MSETMRHWVIERVEEGVTKGKKGNTLKRLGRLTLCSIHGFT